MANEKAPPSEQEADHAANGLEEESGVYIMDLKITGRSRLPFFVLTGVKKGTKEEAFDRILVQTPSVCPVGDFAMNRAKLILSRKAADILEALEPGLHGFRPLQIEMKSTRYRKRFEDKEYQLVDVKVALDIVDILRSDVYAYVSVLPPLSFGNALSFRTPNRRRAREVQDLCPRRKSGLPSPLERWQPSPRLSLLCLT